MKDHRTSGVAAQRMPQLFVASISLQIAVALQVQSERFIVPVSVVLDFTPGPLHYPHAELASNISHGHACILGTVTRTIDGLTRHRTEYRKDERFVL